MLENLPYDVLNVVCQLLVDPQDYMNLYSTCKNTNNFIKYHCQDITVHLEYNSSIIFLREMKGLKNINIFRTYDCFLDFTPILKNKNLSTIYVNNPINIFNIPRNVLMFNSNDLLISYEQVISYSDDEYEEDEFDHILTAKEYFTLRYNMKKYGKMKYEYKYKYYNGKNRQLRNSI
jgi:hypothetical protein